MRIACLVVAAGRGTRALRNDGVAKRYQLIGAVPVLARPLRAFATHPRIDPAALLPTGRAYFAYAGSLTTPPCTEGVNWLVLRTPVAIAPAQIERLAGVLHHNNRDVQARHGRPVRAIELNVD